MEKPLLWLKGDEMKLLLCGEPETASISIPGRGRLNTSRLGSRNELMAQMPTVKTSHETCSIWLFC